MTKITLNSVGSIVDATTAQTTINNNFNTIQTAFDNTLSRDGTQPNTMGSALDMNSWEIVNLPNPTGDTSPLRLQDLKSFIGGGTIQTLPSGGTTAQALVKNSNTNYDVKWGNTVTSVGLALPADFNVTGSPIVNAGTLTGAWAVTPTGSGAVVRANTPTLVTPVLGAATGTSLQLSSLTASSALATDGSKNLVSVANTGTGNNVLATSPTLVTPALGTPSALVGTNITGTAAGFTAGTVTTNANLTGVITSSGNATSIASQTGTGTKFVVDTSPTLVTPILGTAAYTALSNSGNNLSPVTIEKTGGDLFSMRYNSSNPRFVFGAGGGSGSTFMGANMVWSGAGNVWNYDKTAPAWWMGNLPSGSAAFYISAATGTAGNPIGTDALAASSIAVYSTRGVHIGAVAQADPGADSLSVDGSMTSAGIQGYVVGVGAGGTITQATSRTTGVTLNKPTGAITLFTAAGSATAATFTVTNSVVGAFDTIVMCQKSGTNLYEIFVTAVAAGSFNVTFLTTGGTASDAPVFNYCVYKGSAT